MTREELVALLAAHEPADVEEAADLERMRGWAETLERPFSREQPGAHFTASAIVVDESGDRTVLVHHRKSGNWFQPGGHFERVDASAGEAALREAREETGLTARLGRPGLLDVDVHWVPWDEHYHLDLRFHVVAVGELAPDRAEVHAASGSSSRTRSSGSRSRRSSARSPRPCARSGRVERWPTFAFCTAPSETATTGGPRVSRPS